MSVSLSVWFTCLSVCLVCLSVCLFVCLFVCMPDYVDKMDILMCTVCITH